MLQQRIMQSASIRKTTGDVLVSFPLEQGTFLTPRGRYAIELYDYFLRMRGQKYDYKIKYDDINRLFLLPKPDEVHMCFVIALDKPIRQGQQRYQYLVLQATKEMDEVTVNMDEDTLQKEYNGELQPVMRGSLSNLIAKTFKVIAQKKVFIPGKFANANQQACVKCAVRASEGFLFPLEKQFVFIHKPTIIIRFNEIESVDFQRYAGGQGSTRNFDLQVNLKASVAAGQPRDYTFSGIDRSDYAGLFNFLTAKKITVKNIEGTGFLEEQAAREPVYNEDEIYGGPDEDGMEEDSEDEDFDEAAAAEEEAEAAEDDSEADMDDDEMGSEIDDGLDSDLDDVRKDSKAKKKKKAKAAEADDDEGQSSPKKKRKQKDPNAPKKAMNAYFLYANSVRSEIAAKNPDSGFGDITKLVSSQYKNLSDGERKVWDSKAQAEKKRYQEEMADYSAPEDSDGEDEAPTKKAKKDPNAPKASRSAYNYFGQEMRGTMKAEDADLSFAEINKTLGERWKAVSPEEKERFEKLAAEDKKRHTREMASYTPPKGSPAGKKKKPKKDPNAPKSALTTFLIFSKEMRPKIKAENPDIQFSDMGRKLGELFRALTSEEKEKYEKLAQEDKVRYEKENKAYLKPLPPDDGVDDDTDGDMEDDDDDDDDE
jgi:structure-specific recognition protein 1